MNMHYNKSLFQCPTVLFLLILPLLVSGCLCLQDKDPIEKYYVYDKQSQKRWESDMAEWMNTSSICSQFQTPVSRTGVWQLREFAQSFTAHCKGIEAVQVKVYPLGQQNGWVRLELLQDEKGAPGNILARTFLRIEKGCPVGYGGYMTFPIKHIKVIPEATYWITVVEYPDWLPVPERHIWPLTNVGLSDGIFDLYSEGKLLVLADNALQEKRFTAVNFTIISKSSSDPGIHPASERDKQTLPPEDCRNTYWQDATDEWYRFLVTR